MNPEEGKLRGQFLDRFGLYAEVAGEQDVAVRAEIIRRRLDYERDRALKNIENTHPGLMEGRCWSVWELAAHPEKIPEMLADAESCQFGLVYFHGGVQSLPGFPEVWRCLIDRMPVYIETSLPDEIAQLLPESGLTAEQWQAVNRYFGLGDEKNITSLNFAGCPRGRKRSRFSLTPCPATPRLAAPRGWIPSRASGAASWMEMCLSASSPPGLLGRRRRSSNTAPIPRRRTAISRITAGWRRGSEPTPSATLAPTAPWSGCRGRRWG